MHGYNPAHFFSRAVSRPPGMNIAVAHYSNYIWAAANILMNNYQMNLKILLRLLPCYSIPLYRDSDTTLGVNRRFIIHPLPSMELRDFCQNPISIPTCYNHRKSLVAALRALTGEALDKEDPP